MNKLKNILQRIRNNILDDLDNYYLDDNEWASYENDTTRAFFMTNALDDWFIAKIYFNFDNDNKYVKCILNKMNSLDFSNINLTVNRKIILRDFYLNRAAIKMIIGQQYKNDIIKSEYYEVKMLKEYDHNDGVIHIDSGEEIETFVEHNVYRCIYDAISLNDTKQFILIEKIDSSKEKIWTNSLCLLRAIVLKNDKGVLKEILDKICEEWIDCLVNSNFFSFDNANIIILYYLYCNYTNETFDVTSIPVNY